MMRLPADRQDRVLAVGLSAGALLSGSIVVLIAVFIAVESWPALRSVGTNFLVDTSWHPTAGAQGASFGLWPMVVGTLLISLLALAIAVPLGIMSALFSRFYAPRAVAAVYRRVIELLAGIPSVVYGFWGLVVLVPLVRRLEPPGTSVLAGGLILGFMVLPTVALFADAALGGVPREYIRGTAALGLSRWGSLRGVVLPAARSGILTGVLLGAGRAIGETMAVLMVAGNVVQVPSSVFDPVRVLTANIALEMAYAMDIHRSALFVTGLLLLAMVTALVFSAERLSRRTVRV